MKLQIPENVHSVNWTVVLLLSVRIARMLNLQVSTDIAKTRKSTKTTMRSFFTSIVTLYKNHIQVSEPRKVTKQCRSIETLTKPGSICVANVHPPKQPELKTHKQQEYCPWFNKSQGPVLQLQPAVPTLADCLGKSIISGSKGSKDNYGKAKGKMWISSNKYAGHIRTVLNGFYWYNQQKSTNRWDQCNIIESWAMAYRHRSHKVHPYVQQKHIYGLTSEIICDCWQLQEGGIYKGRSCHVELFATSSHNIIVCICFSH